MKNLANINLIGWAAAIFIPAAIAYALTTSSTQSAQGAEISHLKSDVTDLEGIVKDIPTIKAQNDLIIKQQEGILQSLRSNPNY
jgi:hypothetical protein